MNNLIINALTHNPPETKVTISIDTESVTGKNAKGSVRVFKETAEIKETFGDSEEAKRAIISELHRVIAKERDIGGSFVL